MRYLTITISLNEKPTIVLRFPCSQSFCFPPSISSEMTFFKFLHASLFALSNSFCLASYLFFLAFEHNNTATNIGFGTIPLNKWWYFWSGFVSRQVRSHYWGHRGHVLRIFFSLNIVSVAFSFFPYILASKDVNINPKNQICKAQLIIMIYLTH